VQWFEQRGNAKHSEAQRKPNRRRRGREVSLTKVKKSWLLEQSRARKKNDAKK
jgi:hypothetical protein